MYRKVRSLQLTDVVSSLARGARRRSQSSLSLQRQPCRPQCHGGDLCHHRRDWCDRCDQGQCNRRTPWCNQCNTCHRCHRCHRCNRWQDRQDRCLKQCRCPGCDQWQWHLWCLSPCHPVPPGPVSFRCSMDWSASQLSHDAIFATHTFYNHTIDFHSGIQLHTNLHKSSQIFIVLHRCS